MRRPCPAVTGQAVCRTLLVAVALAAAGLVTCSIATAAPGLIVGLTDDALEARPAETASVARDLGLRAFAVSVVWSPGDSTLSPAAAGSLGTAVAAAGNDRIVVAAYGYAPPETPSERDQYCSYVRDIVTRYPQVHDVVIWNEPNLSAFWLHQFDSAAASRAPGMYEALLERCYDVLHAARPGMNVIAPATSPWGNDDPFARSNVSHSPTSFILELGRAYRAGGRTKPIFDTLGHHPYPTASTERPWLPHSSDRVISTGDLDRLVGTLEQAFGGTAQPTPARGLPIWYLESGYQTVPDASKRGIYYGTENWPGPLPAAAGGEPSQPPPPAESAAPDQATQLVDSIRLAYCQPHVQAVFNFLLRDEADLAGWQSGVLWADGTRKGSYEAMRSVVAEVNNRSVDCTRLKGMTWSDAPAKAVKVPGAATPVAPASGARDRNVDGRLRSRVVWTARNPTPFGYARLAVRLRTGSRPLARRYVSFSVGGAVVVASTNRSGHAAVKLPSPLLPGAHVVSATFAGDKTHQPAAVKVLVRVVNSRGTMATGSLRQQQGSGGRAELSVRSNGRTVEGSFVVRVRSRTVKARRLDAFGVDRRATSAWLAGRTVDGSRLIVNVVTHRGRSVVRLWVGGTQLPSIRGLRVRVSRT